MTGAGRDFGRELYPFLYEDHPVDSDGLTAVLDAVRESTLQKCQDVMDLRRQLCQEYRERLVATALAMANAFANGRKLLAFGNGGSATDAQDAAADCMLPPFDRWRPLPALALTNDVAVVTAVANDVGFENVFLRQVIAFGEPGDIALGFSTSGNSPNVLTALTGARRRGLLTVALAGNDGGVMAQSPDVGFCFIARTEHLPRIQEGQATVWHTLLELVQEVLAGRKDVS